MRKIRVFEVELEHLRFGTNWDSQKVVARTAVEAIKRAERDADNTQIRAVGVTLIAEAI